MDRLTQLWQMGRWVPGSSLLAKRLSVCCWCQWFWGGGWEVTEPQGPRQAERLCAHLCTLLLLPIFAFSLDPFPIGTRRKLKKGICDSDDFWSRHREKHSASPTVAQAALGYFRGYRGSVWPLPHTQCLKRLLFL